MPYSAPLNDIRSALKAIDGVSLLNATQAHSDVGQDLVDQILEEAGKFTTEVLAPLNQPGDEQGSHLVDGKVVTPDGWVEAYGQFVAGGWNGVAGPEAHGGMALPVTLATAVFEMVTTANMSFGLCPLLTQGAIHAIELHGTDAQKDIYLEKLVTGEWTGSMNLTEAQAGSDVGALTSKAEPVGDGTYRITGTKIFITYGEHEMTGNIAHLVLARLPDAPLGTRGISLFIVPKFLVNPDGSLGARNPVHCLKLEEKLGIHASPTCILSYEGALGTLIGGENRGMAAMFTMMNDARLGVGVQGVGIMERAFQHALDYAQERRQGKPVGKQHDQKEMVPIFAHADIRRILLTMKAHTQAARLMCYDTALHTDLAHCAQSEEERASAQARVDLLTPLAKAWPTDKAMEMASLGLQLHGGMGFIEETGAAQYVRDARIAPIYEGTNGIQAIDLVSRKLPMDGGQVVKDYLAEIDDIATQCRASNQADMGVIADFISDANNSLKSATDWMLGKLKSGEIEDALAGATPYALMFGTIAGATYLTRGALMAQTGDQTSDKSNAMVTLARFFAENELPQAAGLATTATAGGDLLSRLTAEDLGG